MISSTKVIIASEKAPWVYPKTVPFLPDEIYPELQGKIQSTNEGQNISYRLLRQLFRRSGFDEENFSTKKWNPLGVIIKPGQKVLIKPNLVRHLHLTGGNYQAVVTHASLVRCVLDYVAIALKGKGQIVVGDAPVQSTNFELLLQKTGLKDVCRDVSNTWNMPIKVVDFRRSSVVLNDSHRVTKAQNLSGDPDGYSKVNLSTNSNLMPIIDDYHNFRVTNYDPVEMAKHHNASVNEYLIPKTVLESDVVINLPKLKTHRKVGLTTALKNLVGINGNKDWLPHHRVGSVSEKGDEYQRKWYFKRLQTNLLEKIDKAPFSKLNSIYRILSRSSARINKHLAPDPFIEGSWFGNDTAWRMVLDLNKLLVYANKNGEMENNPQRITYSIVDGIIAGEGEGPMEPDAKPCGIVVGGLNPVAVDAVISTMIGFDLKKIPLIFNGFSNGVWPLTDFNYDDIEVSSFDKLWDSLKVGIPSENLNFNPTSGWKGNIEF